jgi:hypothetical protein
MLPVMIELLCRTNGNERAAIARRYDALLALLSETFASRLGAWGTLSSARPLFSS